MYKNSDYNVGKHCSLSQSWDISKLPSLTPSINEKNIGAGLSRNKGIKYANGKYVAFCDADDLWHKDKLKLPKEEKNKLISAKDESQWYKIIEDIKSVRNNLYPNDLAREILAIYHNKFPVNNYPVFEDSKQSKIDRKSFLTTLSVAWVAFAAATGGFLTVLIRFLFPNVLTVKNSIWLNTSILFVEGKQFGA